MKKLLLSCVVLAGSLQAAEGNLAPTVYGSLNKEVQMISQDKDFKQSTFRPVVDPINADTRIGVRNEYTISDGMKVGYQIELGVNTNWDGYHPDDQTDPNIPVGENLSIRHSYIHVSDFWGKIIAGKANTPSLFVLSAVDPLYNTSLGYAGADQSTLVAGAQGIAGGLGMWNRSRKAQLTYVSPRVAGVQVTVGYDKNGQYALKEKDAGSYLEAIVHYNLTQEKMALNVWAGLITLAGGKANTYNGAVPVAGSYISKDQTILLAASFNMKPFTVYGSFETRTNENYAAEVKTSKPVRNWMTLAGKFDLFEKDYVAVTFANYIYDAKPVAGTSTKAKYTQIAAGYNHFVSDQVNVRLTAGNLSVKDVGAIRGTTKTKNSAMFLDLGAQVTF